MINLSLGFQRAVAVIQWVDGVNLNMFPLMLPMAWCSKPIPSMFLQNIFQYFNKIKATQGNGVYVVNTAGLRSTF